MSECAYCQSETRDQVICPRCTRVTAAHLADMGEHQDELTTVMIKDTVYSEKSDGGKSADPTIAWAGMGDRFLEDVAAEVERNPIATPYAKAAAALLREVRATLVSWTRLLREERRVGFPGANTIAVLADHLHRNMNIIASHEAAGEFVAEIHNLVKRIVVVIDAPPFRVKKQLGHCIEVVDGMHCHGEVFAYIHADASVLGKLECKRCKREWEPTEWKTVGPLILAAKRAA